MSTQSDNYPGYERRRFESCEEELRTVRGLPSSRDWEAKAQIADLKVKSLQKRIETLTKHRAVYLEIAADESQSLELREEAARLAVHIEANSQLRNEEELKCRQEFAAQMHQFAEQARRIEARWSFDPYTDPLLDRVERELKLESAQATRKGSRRKRK